MIVRGRFLQSLYRSDSEKLLASGIIYFQISDQVQPNYSVNLDFTLLDPSVIVSSNDSSECGTLNAVSDQVSQWQTASCSLLTASDVQIQCFCADGQHLSNFAGLVSVAALLPVFDSTTTTSSTSTEAQSTTGSEVSSTSASSTETSTSSSQSSTSGPCDWEYTETVFTYVYVCLGLSLGLTIILLLAILFATRYSDNQPQIINKNFLDTFLNFTSFLFLQSSSSTCFC